MENLELQQFDEVNERRINRSVQVTILITQYQLQYFYYYFQTLAFLSLYKQFSIDKIIYEQLFIK